RPRRIIRQWVAGQDRRNRRAHRHEERIARRSGSGGIGCRIDPFSLIGGRYRENLRRSQHLPESRILAKKIGLTAAVVNSRQDHWPAYGYSEFIAHEGRNPPRVQLAGMIEEIPRIESGVAHKFKPAAVQLIRP